MDTNSTKNSYSDDKKKTLLLTGVTGFIGRHLALSLLKQGHSLILLSRATSTRSALERVHAVLKPLCETDDVFNTFCSRLMVLCGDVTEPLPDIAALKQVDEIIHLASNLDFRSENRDPLIQTNVEGTRHMLALALKLQAKRFQFVSTAYVCGKTEGLVTETLIPKTSGPTFHNPYEESKYLAEHCVAEWSNASGIPCVILRPGIVVASERTDSTFGYYAFAKALLRFGKEIAMLDGRIRLPANLDTTLNLVSIQDITAWISAIIDGSNSPDRLIEIFHLTNEAPPTIRQCFAHPIQAAGLGEKVEIVTIQDYDYPEFYRSLGIREEAFTKKLLTGFRDLLPYLFLDVKFDLHNLKTRLKDHYSPHPITDRDIEDLIRNNASTKTTRPIRFIPSTFNSTAPPAGPVETGIVTFLETLFKALIQVILRPSGLSDIRALYAREAPSYRLKHHLTTAFNDARLRKRTAKIIKAHLDSQALTQPAQILDIATGTGLTPEALFHVFGHTAAIYGIDFNPDMLAIGIKRLKKEGRGDSIRLLEGDATNFVAKKAEKKGTRHYFSPYSIDAISTVFGIGGIAEPTACFDQQLRALKEGGIAILIDMHAPFLDHESTKLPFGLPASPLLVYRAWQAIIKPIVLKDLWGWADPTETFYRMPLAAYYDAKRDIYFGFEVINRRIENMKWWFLLPVMPVSELIVKKVEISKEAFRLRCELLGKAPQ